MQQKIMLVVFNLPMKNIIIVFKKLNPIKFRLNFFAVTLIFNDNGFKVSYVWAKILT